MREGEGDQMLRRSMRWRVGTALTMFAVLSALIATSGLGAGAQEGAAEPAGSFQGEETASLDLDARGGRVAPVHAQRADAAALGAAVRWNRFGTPASLVPVGDALATGLSGHAAEAARTFVADNADLFRISSEDVEDLELLYDVRIGRGNAVLFRQRFGGLPAGQDGQIALGVIDGSVVYASSTLAPGAEPSAVTRSPSEAVVTAARDVGIGVGLGDVTDVERRDGASIVTVDGVTQPAYVELVAVPVPGGEVRSAHDVTLLDDAGQPLGVRSLVDAATGEVLVREDLVDYLEPSKWEVFPASPPLDYASIDTRETWCWDATGTDCDRVVGNETFPFPWDYLAPAPGTTTNTTNGNNSFAVHNWNSNDPFSVGTEMATARPDQDYVYGWTNQWFEERCNPGTTFTSPERNDIDAARANLFAMHNRMHDWSYHLGFTEETFNLQRDNLGAGGLAADPERGNAQAGGISGGPPGFAARNNANQITPRDGLPPTTNMYLWQPFAGAFYARCVDGDYDMTVIGHEYGHAISNRMVAGPNAGLSGFMGGAMGESWSDLNAMEVLNEYGFVPVADENPYAIGPYVTGDQQAAIRNYGMNASPLNFSDVGYDFACNVNQQGFCQGLSQVHADGEIWSAVNFAIREAFLARYDAAFPSGDLALQTSCAEGLTDADECPGNRRWIQLVYDAWLLMASGAVSMLDARDAMLAADLVRFGGANQDLLWNTFASRGFGDGAIQTSANDVDPVPSFVSPFLDEATVTFAPADLEGSPIEAELFVGTYEGRVTPVADTDAGTPLADTVDLVPGTYGFIARADGFGATRFTLDLKANMEKLAEVSMAPNLASSTNGATATGEGTNLAALIDDTEASNWAFLGAAGAGVSGRNVTVRLDPSRPSWQVDRIQVSAQLRTRDQNDPGGDTLSQNRFSALRSFEIWTCEVKADVDCSDDGDFGLLFESPEDAFPAVAPRPRAPNLVLTEFDVPKTRATFVRIVVVTNQCTGTPAFAGDQDDDPVNVTDCAAGTIQDDIVRIAELQVFQK
jgi:extracellular elastinolytic metalloproteinase